jgi:hypothetical protein
MEIASVPRAEFCPGVVRLIRVHSCFPDLRTMNHRDTETRRKAALAFGPLCLCVSVVQSSIQGDGAGTNRLNREGARRVANERRRRWRSLQSRGLNSVPASFAPYSCRFVFLRPPNDGPQRHRDTEKGCSSVRSFVSPCLRGSTVHANRLNREGTRRVANERRRETQIASVRRAEFCPGVVRLIRADSCSSDLQTMNHRDTEKGCSSVRSFVSPCLRGSTVHANGLNREGARRVANERWRRWSSFQFHVLSSVAAVVLPIRADSCFPDLRTMNHRDTETRRTAARRSVLCVFVSPWFNRPCEPVEPRRSAKSRE